MPALDLANAIWRKSSRSAGNGGNCVEVAAVWRKSSHSTGNGNCVEVSTRPAAVAIRDTKDRDGGTLIFAPAEWAAFIEGAKNGVFDLAD